MRRNSNSSGICRSPCRGCCKTKRLLLLREMLEELDYPDKDLVKDISFGFKLTGRQEKTGVFPSSC